MESIEAMQEHLYEELMSLGDGFEQYEYLIQLSVSLPAMDKEEKKDERLVKGCQSKVWLNIHTEDNIFRFEADSDTLILKGILSMLQIIYNGQRCEEVASSNIWLFAKTSLMASFNSDRQKGIGYIIKKLQKAAVNR